VHKRRSSLLVPALISSLLLLPLFFLCKSLSPYDLHLAKHQLSNTFCSIFLIENRGEKGPPLYSSCSASSQKIERKPETLTDRNEV